MKKEGIKEGRKKRKKNRQEEIKEKMEFAFCQNSQIIRIEISQK